MPDYKTPGVFVEEIPKLPTSVAQVETAIPAFIGYTFKAKKSEENDLRMVPTPVSSLLEYVELYGGPQPEQHLEVIFDQEVDANDNLLKETVVARFNTDGDNGPSRHVMFYALQQYFANGGGKCYIVSVGGYIEPFGTLITNQTDLTDALANLETVDEPTLLLFPESQGMDPGTYQGVYDAALLQCQDLQDRFTIIDFQESGGNFETTGDLDTAVQTFRNRIGGETDKLKYGAAYFPNVLSTFNYVYEESGVTIIHTRGGNPGDQNGKTLNAPDLPNVFRTKAQLAIDQFSINLPPGPTMAGVYARVDETRGVWKAPANVNLSSVSDISYKVNDNTQRDLNVDVTAGKSINVIRFFVGRGIKVWGARTLAGNDNEWRYISVRRFFNMVEESVKKATEAFVFEPNDKNTWVRVRGMIENFLLLQWRAGALQGAAPEQAFYVRVGLPETMTALDILEGRMIVEIGMAVVRPAEFIILRFSHMMAES